MTYGPYKPLMALGYALLFPIVAFVWAPFVAMTPSLREVTIPYIANNPVISFPVLIIWPVMAFFLSKSYLKSADEKAREGLKLGATFAVASFALDLLVVVFLVGVGIGHYAQLAVWLGYTMLLVIPWLVGRSLERTANRNSASSPDTL